MVMAIKGDRRVDHKMVRRSQIPFGSQAGFLERFVSDRRGVIAVMFALMLPILVGAVGLGVEVGFWYQHRRDVQTLADAAALAGAYEAQDSAATSSTITTAATADATRNGYSVSTDSISAANPPASGSYTSDSGAVSISVSRTVQLLFAGWFLGSSSVTVSASAVATSVTGGDEACVLALSSSASRAVGMSGGASVSMDGCQVASNSTASDSIYVSNNSSLTVDCVTTAGNIDGTEDITYNVCASGNESASTITDPYASLTVPAEAADCDTNSNTSSSDGQTFSLANNDTNGDGYVVFCGAVSINSGDSVTFDSDTVFVFNGDDLTINGGADVSGSGVTFLFTGSGSNQNGWSSASVNGGGTVDLTAPTSGDWAGILFFQDSDAPSHSSLNMTFNGNSDTDLTGVIYVPNNDLSFTGGNELDDNGCLQLVANEISFSGNADFENECTGTGVQSIYTSYTVSLVE